MTNAEYQARKAAHEAEALDLPDFWAEAGGTAMHPGIRKLYNARANAHRVEGAKLAAYETAHGVA